MKECLNALYRILLASDCMSSKLNFLFSEMRSLNWGMEILMQVVSEIAVKVAIPC